MLDPSTYKKKNSFYKGRNYSLHNYLMPVFSNIYQKKGFIHAGIVLDWQKIVGKEFSQTCQADKITFPLNQRTGGCLHLSTTGSNATTLSYYKDIILEKINKYYGYNAVQSLKITHDLKMDLKKNKEIKKSAFLPKNHFIQDHDDLLSYDSLSQALINLGQEIFRKSQ